jgi:hypothetical protein
VRVPNARDLNRLEQIKDEILELNNEALTLVEGTSEEGRARAYWVAHIRQAVYAGWGQDTLKHATDRLRKEAQG